MPLEITSANGGSKATVTPDTGLQVYEISSKKGVRTYKPVTATKTAVTSEPKKYSLKLGGTEYQLSETQMDWIKTRYAADASVIDPKQIDATYTASTLDGKLKQRGLPSSKYILDYMSSYDEWYGDGTTYTFSADAQKSIGDKFKSSWTYDYTVEDQRRKKQGLAPVKVAAKYADSYTDSQLLAMGLPPSSDLGKYVEDYDTVLNETAKVNYLYDLVTAKIMDKERELGGYAQLGDTARMAIFDEVYASSEFDDIRHLFQKSPEAESTTNPTDTLEEYEAKWAAMGKKSAASDEPVVSWADFTAGYQGRKSKILTSDAAYSEDIEDAQKTTTASLKDKDGVQQYIRSRGTDKAVDILADMFEARLPIGRIREAKDYLLGLATTEEEKKAIRTSVREIANAYTREHYSASENADKFKTSSERKAEREAKRLGDSTVKNGAVKQYDAGMTSAITVDVAEEIFNSHLVYGDDGKPTKESIALATNMMYEAGATTPVVLEVGKRAGMKNGILSRDYADTQKESLQTAMAASADAMTSGVTPVTNDESPNDLTAFNPAFSTVVSERDLKQRKELMDASYQANVESGKMTRAEFYNAVRRAGWSDTIDIAKQAEVYYDEVYAPKFKKNGEILPSWEEIDQAAFTEYFANEKDLDPEVHKTPEEIAKGSLTRTFTSGVFEAISGTVSFLDMATAKASGRTDTWEFTKRANEAARASEGVASNQSFGSQVANVASTVAGQYTRMMIMSEIGSGVLSMFSKPAAAIGQALARTNAGNILSSLSSNVPAVSKGISAIVKGSKWAIQSTPFITTSMGSYYSEAIQGGASIEQAVPYATVCGLMEGAFEAVGTELWLGRMFGSQAIAKEIITAGRSVFKATSVYPKALLIRLVASTLGNAIEEVGSYAVSIGMQKRTYNADAEFDWNEAAEQGAMGALIGLFGAGMNYSADTQLNILAEFFNSEAGQKWASEAGQSAVNDLMFMSVIAKTAPSQLRAQMQLQDNGTSTDEVSATVRNIDQISRQMEDGQKKYDADMAKFDAEFQAKKDALSTIEEQMSDPSLSNKEYAKLNKHRIVALSELEVETAQVEAKRTERTKAFTEDTEQHKIDRHKAQQKLLGMSISVMDAFSSDIVALGNLARNKVTTVPNEIGEMIIAKMDAARAGRLIDFMQKRNEIQQGIQYESVKFPNAATTAAEGAGAAQTPTGDNVVMFGQNDAESTPISPVVAGEQTAQPANVAMFDQARNTAGAKAVESLNDRAIEMERQPLSFSKEEMPFVDSAVKAVSSISAEVGTDIKATFPYAKSIVGMDYVSESMQDIALRVLNGDAEYLDGENLTRQIERVIGTVRIDFVPTEVGLLGHDGAEIRDIRNQIRKTKISIGAYTATGFKYSVDDSIRTDKSLFGTIRLSKSGTAQSADALYYELSNAYPDLFDPEIVNPSDQIRVMADFVRMTYNGRAESLSKIKSGEYVYYLARDVAEKFVARTMDSYFGVASLRNENGGEVDGEVGAVESTSGIVAETSNGSAQETERNEAGTRENQGSAKVSRPQNPAETMGGVGITAGAMRSKKWLYGAGSKVSQFYENTLAWMDSDEASTEVRDAGQAFDESFTYDVVSEKESIAKAQEKLARGITPELLESLRIRNTWTGVDVDVAMGIKEFYRNQGVATGDYTDYLNWSMLIADRVGENARALQALAKYSRDAREMALAAAQKNVKEAEKKATPKQKEKIESQKKDVGKAIDEAVETNATPDAVEETIQKTVKKQTAKTIKDAFIKLQDGKIDRAAFDTAVSDSIKVENGLPVFTAENAKRVIELLDQADQQADEYERKKYTSMAAKIIANAQGVSFIDKFRSFQRVMMLLNPRTMVRNVVANVVFTPLEWLKDVPTTLADMIASKATGERTTTVSIEKTKAWVAGLKRGGSEVGKDFKNKVNTSRSGKYEITNKDIWKSHFLQMLDNLVGYGLNAGDRPFYEAAYDEFMMNEQLLGHDTNSEEVNQRVVALALDRVFQGNPKLNEVLKGLRNSLDKTGIPIGTLLLPFTQTPANLADKLLEYSPAGLIEAAVQLGKAKSTGVFDQKQFVDRVGRSITGTGLMILGYVLAKSGVINMAGDDDKERQAMKNAGVSAYSIQLGDTSISINWAEPIGSIVIMGATLAKIGASSDSLNALQAIWGGSKMLINSFFSNTVLSNVASLFGAGYGDVASGFESFALGSSTQFLPSSLAAIARTLDPYERDTYDPNVFLQQGKRILSYFPGLRQLLPFKYGTDGKPVESNYGDTFFDRVFNTMVNPALVDTKSGDPVNDEIYRLYQSGFTDQLLPLAGKTLGNQKLTAEQRREYQRVLGEASYNAAMRVIASSGYASLTDEQKVDALNDAIGDATDDAREGFKEKNGLN